MAIPIKVILTDGDTTGLQEFTDGDAIAVEDGGTGAVDLAGARTNLNIDLVDNTSDETKHEDTALTGTPVAPTAANGTETTQLATTEFVQQELRTTKEW